MTRPAWIDPKAVSNIVITTLVGLVLSGTAWAFTMKSDIHDHDRRLATIEQAAQRREEDHDRIVRIETNVDYIKSMLRRDRDMTRNP